MISIYILALFVLTMSGTFAKPLSLRMRRSSENDHLPKTADDSLTSQLNSFQLPSWLQFYKTFLDNIVDDKILPEMKETNVEVSAFFPHGRTLENSFEPLQSEDVGDLNILSSGGMSDWEINNITPELGAAETVDKLEVSDDTGAEIDNFDQSVELGETKLNDDSLISILGTPWGMIQNLRESAEDINNYEVDISDDKVSDGLENLSDIGDLNVPSEDGKDLLENFGSDDIITFNDINNMLSDDAFDNAGDTDTLTGIDVSDVHENTLENGLSNSVDDIDSTVEVAGIEIPTAAMENNEVSDSAEAIDSTLERGGMEISDEVDNTEPDDSTAEVGGIEVPHDDSSGSEFPEVGETVDSTLEVGGMEFPTSEDAGVEFSDGQGRPDSTIEVGGMEFPTSEGTGVEFTDGQERQDSTIEVGGMEFPTSEGTGVEFTDGQERQDSTIEVGGMEFPTSEGTGVEFTDGHERQDSTIEVGGMEFPTGHAAEAVPEISDKKLFLQEVSSDVDSGAIDSDSSVELPTLNDEMKLEVVGGLSDDSNVDTPSVAEALIEVPNLNDENIVGLQQMNVNLVTDTHINDLVPEAPHSIDELMNDEPVT